MLKIVALPLTFLYGGLKFYDEVWIRWDREAEQAAAAGQESLRELQAINAEVYQMNASGEGDRVDAYLEANQGRISRLVAEATDLWRSQPEYFLSNEKQVLANALLVEGRNDLALEIAEDWALDAEGPLEEANAALFLGRITGGKGPAHDLGAMRDHMKRALGHWEGLDEPGQSSGMAQQILIAWIFFELSEGNCDQAEPIASLLRDLTLPTGEPGRGLADRMADELLHQFAQRCPAQ
jgi:hypothetical protein